METNLPAEAAQAKNKLEAETWFYRVSILFTDTTTEYVCNNTEDFDYGGNTYRAMPFELTPLTKSTSGELPTRQMTVSGAAVQNFLVPYIRNKDGVRNATVTITKVLSENPAIDMSATAEVYTASHYTSTDQTITIHLGYPRLRNQQIPLYQYGYIRCRVYSEFKGKACEYAGAETTCDGTPERCCALNNLARWNAEIGLKPKTIRLA